MRADMRPETGDLLVRLVGAAFHRRPPCARRLTGKAAFQAAFRHCRTSTFPRSQSFKSQNPCLFWAGRYVIIPADDTP